MRRVVVTGLGAVTPLGDNVYSTWRSLLAGKCGIVSFVMKGFESIPSKVAGIVSTGFDENRFANSSEKRYLTRGAILALAAAHEAVSDASLDPTNSTCDPSRMGVSVSSSVDYQEIYKTGAELYTKGYKRVSPFFVPKILTNTVAGVLSERYGLLGPNHSVVTACTTGLHAIGDAASMVSRGVCDVMLAGAGDSTLHPIGLAGFSQCRALSRHFNDSPAEASRPFDSKRDGFVMSEGAGIVILESLDHAIKRGVEKIYAEIIGYGMSSDAFHITSPSPEGIGAINSMKNALSNANLLPNRVGYVNAHATSTPIGDKIENEAIKNVFGEHAYKLNISSTKGATGHLVTAAGVVEAIFCCLAVVNGLIPPTINLHEKESEFDLNYTPHALQHWPNIGFKDRIAITNSFGFGGTNASVILKSYPSS
ncbi:3-oxoacyl- synthase, mitochondrial [Oopsacas minuta]|uniref:3-oxoacyl-[acyl-carrier-protein] synthase n=1 Tax=Oopsacas minuta TaxID=111878 RepID=A0AAV7K8N1_9METZ|nr:3-oxoacyl- synthase, mitochondrial [Oopsacas minuta]